jgi:hypothetical protein
MGEFFIELFNYSGTELINSSVTEELINSEMESINYSGTAPGKRCPTCRAAGREV